MNRTRAALVDRLEASGEDFLWYLGLFDDDELHIAPSPDEWTIHQIAAHMRDNEQRVFLARTERIIRETHPSVENFEQDLWIREHYDPKEPLKKITAEFRTARRKLIKLLRGSSPKDWTNWAQHPEYGKISLDWLTQYNYHHTLEHIAQMGRAREQKLLNELNA